MDDNTSTQRWPLAITMILVLLVAAGLRLYRLPELPLGLHYDEAANGILAGEIARGVSAPIFISSYTGKEVLFFYWAALWMKLLGVTPLALRLSAALAGLTTVAATAWAVRELLHGWQDAEWMALLAAAFVATSFWHVILSRYGFRAATQPLMQALTVAELWHGLRASEGRTTDGWPWFLLAGLFCGLTAYTYLAARAFPVPLAAGLCTLLIGNGEGAGEHRRARMVQLALFVAVATLVLTPLAYYWLTHPASFLNRTRQVAAASWAEAWAGIRACLGMLFLRGDPYVRFNLPHRPLLDPITATLSFLGLITLLKPSAVSVKRPVSRPTALPSRVFLLLYLPVMLLPSALAVGDVTPSNLRTVGLLPFIYVFPALGLSALKAQIRRYAPSVSRHLALAIRQSRSHSSCVILLLAILTPITATAYFSQWAVSKELYYASDGDLADVATYLNQADLSATIPYVASIHYRHPTVAFLAEDYDAIRWLTDGRTIVLPMGGAGPPCCTHTRCTQPELHTPPGEPKFTSALEKNALLIFPHSTSGDLDWIRTILPDSALAAAPPSPDGAPAFHAYRVGPALDLKPTRPLTADLAHVALILGYDVVGTPRAGEGAEVAIWWRVLNRPDEGDYGPIARLTDPWGFSWGQTQPFHYPSEQWTPGELIVDHLTIPVAPGAPPGDYLVRFSLYSPATNSRLPVLDGAGRHAGTAVELPLHLKRAETPPPSADLDIRNRLNARAGELTLLGVNLDTKTVRPGERLHLTLFWQADAAPMPDIDVQLTLGETTLYAGAPVHATYPTSHWTAGEIVADRYDPRLQHDFPPGDHSLRVGLRDPAAGQAVSWSGGGEEGEPLALGTVTVLATDRVFDAPSISHTMTATLGDQVDLLGYELSPEKVAPGEALTLTLYWRTMTEMEEDYTVFTHLLASDGSMVGQHDSQPVGGTYPTSLWLSGEVVADSHEILVRADAGPGAHRLEVGMYVAETGVRLPIAGTSDDAIILQLITVTGP